MNVSDCIVVGLGGNALNRRDEPFTLQHQRERLTAAAAALIPALDGSPAVITHGNGPQIGALAVRASSDDVLGEPLDVLGAESDAMIGYELELALRSVAPGREIVMVLTATEVDPIDGAFVAPTKPIGPLCSAESARRWADEHGWTMAPEVTTGSADAGAGDNRRWRRLVPSPEPVCIVELGAIARLIDAGVTVICAGGGGVPVVRGRDGELHGVEAVVDKDFASALLAIGVRARQFVLLTDVPGVMRGFGTSQATVIDHLTVSEARALDLAPGSMGPKVEACCRFAQATGRSAVIGSLDDVGNVMAGRSGTRIERCPSVGS